MNKKISINQKIAISVSVLIFLFSLFSLYMLNRQGDFEADPISKGVLDLSGMKIQDMGLVNLDGDWELYPGVFLTEAEDFSQAETYTRVPGNISNLAGAKVDSGYGGTYRLLIKVPEDGNYGIKTKTIRNAARVILNGAESLTVGNPALTEADHTQGSRYGLAFVKSEDKKIEIIIHTSSYRLKEGGILKSIAFGSYENILSLDRGNRTVDGAVIIICIVIAIHSALSWSTRRNEKFLLYAGLTSLFMGIYYSTIEEQLMISYFNFDFFTRTKLQAIVTILLAYAFMRFVQYYYTELKLKKIVDILSLGLLFSMLFVFLIRMASWNFTTGTLQILILSITIISLIFPTLVVIRMAWKRKEKGFGLILATVLFTFELIVGLKILFELDFAQIPAALLVVFNFSLSLLMQDRLRKEKVRAESLSQELIIRDKMKDDFLARTSRELRNPLHTITNLSSLMLEGEKGPLNIDQQEDMFFISMEGKKLFKLVEDLMDASAIEARKFNLNRQKVFPYQIVKSVVEEYSLTGKQGKDLKLINEITDDFPAIYVDLDRFLQLLVHLLDNAVKFSDQGTIKISGKAEGKIGVFTLKDTGRGIRPNDLTQIFDSSFRSGDKEEEGLGLGLTIVKQIVDNHGGQIWAESSLGQGTEVHFTLPLYDEELADKTGVSIGMEAGETVKRIEAPKANILIVEDDKSNIKILKELLETEGYRFFVKETSKNVLTTIKENSIHLVIIDIMLPDTSGDKLCKIIREDYTMAELPIIMMTASGRGIDLTKSFECGANDFVKKPIDVKDLRARVRSQLLMKASYEASLEREFNYFYSQLSPHFLYNTLSTIIGLSFTDIEGARKALENLGIYLRMKMDSQIGGKMVSLAEEIELMTAYLDIEKIRFGERLEIEITGVVDSQLLIPPLTLQPLVENSVRYGINHREVLKIGLDVKEVDDQVYLRVSDNGPGIKDEEKQRLLKGEGEGSGLTNLIRRIKIQRTSYIEIEDAPGGGTIISITMPKEYKHESNLS